MGGPQSFAQMISFKNTDGEGFSADNHNDADVYVAENNRIVPFSPTQMLNTQKMQGLQTM